jgi:hypothetical protein
MVRCVVGEILRTDSLCTATIGSTPMARRFYTCLAPARKRICLRCAAVCGASPTQKPTKGFLQCNNVIEKPTFELGQIVGTLGAVAEPQKAGQRSGEFRTRHVNRDWGGLSEEDRKENEYSLASRDHVTAPQEVAGACKTTSLSAIRHAAERRGYDVRVLAPTWRAARKLNEVGIESSTLQLLLARGQ